MSLKWVHSNSNQSWGNILDKSSTSCHRRPESGNWNWTQAQYPERRQRKGVNRNLLINTRIIFGSDKLNRIWVEWQCGWGETKGQEKVTAMGTLGGEKKQISTLPEGSSRESKWDDSFGLLPGERLMNWRRGGVGHGELDDVDMADLSSLWFPDQGMTGRQASEARSESQKNEKKIQSLKRCVF